MIRLLIVDDMIVVCEGLKTMLASETGIEIVGFAHDGKKAIEQIVEKKPDVVLIDILMPAMGGIEVTRRIAKQYPQVKVIVLSSFDEDSYIVDAVSAGAKGYLLKTLLPQELAASIRLVWSGYSSWSPNIIEKLAAKASQDSLTNSKSLSRLIKSIVSQSKILALKIKNSRLKQLLSLRIWVILAIVIVTLSQARITSNYVWSGHAALFLLMLALVARPLSRLWAFPLQHRRVIGVTAFILAVTHVVQTLDNFLNWNLNAVTFMLPQHQFGIVAGALALVLITPAAITSSRRCQKALGKRWKQIHLLTIHALLLSVIHTILIGSHYSGGFRLTVNSQLRVVLLSFLGGLILLIRANFFLVTTQKQKLSNTREEATNNS